MEFDGFEWDEGNRVKCQKHGVSISEIESLFKGVPLVGPDPAHSKTERRFKAIGRTAERRVVFVAFTWRGTATERLIRPLSARYMHRREIDAYEKAYARVLDR